MFNSLKLIFVAFKYKTDFQKLSVSGSLAMMKMSHFVGYLLKREKKTGMKH